MITVGNVMNKLLSRTMLVLVLFILTLSVGATSVNAQDEPFEPEVPCPECGELIPADSTICPGCGEILDEDVDGPPIPDVSVLDITDVRDEDGKLIEDYEGMANATPIELVDMSKSITFEVRLTNNDLVFSNTPETRKFKVEFEVKDGEDWNITCKFNRAPLYEGGDAVMYVTEDGLIRGNEVEDLIFNMDFDTQAYFTVEIRPLSSASPGDEVEVIMKLYISDSASTEYMDMTYTYLRVRLPETVEYSWAMYIVLGAAALGLLFAFYLRSIILKADRGNETVSKISDNIHEGAMAFLNKEYRILMIFTLGVALVLVISASYTAAMSYWTAFTFLLGAIFSAAAGNVGMHIATAANSRTAVAVKNKMIDGLRLAFSSGAVMGLTVVSLGLLGVCILYLLFRDPNILFGFGFGASSIALFARVGGGIYTKSADVGADLVGKMEKDIPEDDPRNPATIADNVGDNVGDVAGMGADLFESYVDSIIAAMILGIVGVTVSGGAYELGGFGGKAVLLPMMIAGIGIIASIIGIIIVNTSQEDKNPHGILNSGIFGAAIIHALGSLALIYFWLGWDYFGLWVAMIAGLVSGIIIGLITEYYTSDEFKPTQSISKASKTGAATNIISGLSLGMISTVVPVITVCVALIIAFWLAGLYGIALAAVGMLSTLGITLATDSYGPVADNAAGIAEMAKMGSKVRERAEKLDAVGNTTAAIGKGFAIGSAALTALALFAVYTQATHLSFGDLSLMDPYVISGLFIGALLVFVFSALTMKAVGNAAIAMVEEVRRQFKEIKGLMKGKAEPDYKKCVDIATGGALKQMIFPSLLAVVVPVAIGLILGPEALGGLLAGAVVVGFLMAIMMANSGGAWDNAKKYVEAGNLGGKGSDVHKASIVGDTVGDPFKDTSGPSLNILIKLMSIVALVFAPLFLLFH